ncbi:Ras guanine nucleotide exchange factor A [Pelomyxa schiedti]|nr:Ras guanine nucleotide exchange factor A [Pelomyxa schiedti]
MALRGSDSVITRPPNRRRQCILNVSVASSLDPNEAPQFPSFSPSSSRSHNSAATSAANSTPPAVAATGRGEQQLQSIDDTALSAAAGNSGLALRRTYSCPSIPSWEYSPFEQFQKVMQASSEFAAIQKEMEEEDKEDESEDANCKAETKCQESRGDKGISSMGLIERIGLYGIDGIVIKDNNVHAATPTALCDVLCLPYISDEYVDSLLYTHHYFLSTDTMLEQLISRYENPLPCPSHCNLEESNEQVRSSVLKVLQHWASKPKSMLRHCPNSLNIVANFLGTKLRSPHQEMGQAIKALIKNELFEVLCTSEITSRMHWQEDAALPLTKSSPENPVPITGEAETDSIEECVKLLASGPLTVSSIISDSKLNLSPSELDSVISQDTETKITPDMDNKLPETEKVADDVKVKRDKEAEKKSESKEKRGRKGTKLGLLKSRAIGSFQASNKTVSSDVTETSASPASGRHRSSTVDTISPSPPPSTSSRSESSSFLKRHRERETPQLAVISNPTPQEKETTQSKLTHAITAPIQLLKRSGSPSPSPKSSSVYQHRNASPEPPSSTTSHNPSSSTVSPSAAPTVEPPSHPSSAVVARTDNPPKPTSPPPAPPSPSVDPSPIQTEELDPMLKMLLQVSIMKLVGPRCTTEEVSNLLKSQDYCKTRHFNLIKYKQSFPAQLAINTIKETFGMNDDQATEIATSMIKENLIKSCQRRSSTCFVCDDTAYYHFPPEKTKVRAFPPSILLHSSTEEHSVIAFHPLEVARQLTLMAWNLYNDITIFELTNRVWQEKSRAALEAPNTVKYISFSNHVSKWIVSEIVTTEPASKRTAVIERFIEIAQHCFTFSNFNSCFEVMLGLQKSPVSRLKKSWSGLSRAAKEVFNFLVEFTQPTNNFSKYRQRLKQSYGFCVPYVGLLLQDLFFVEEGNKTFLDAEQLANLPTPLAGSKGPYVNFFKLGLLTTAYKNLDAHKQHQYLFRPVEVIQNYITDFAVLEAEDQMYKQSYQREPQQSAVSGGIPKPATPAAPSASHTTPTNITTQPTTKPTITRSKSIRGALL